MCVALAGAILVASGGCAALAWATGNWEYVQIDQSLPPLHFNGSAGLALCGLGFLVLARGWYRLARLAGGTLAMFALVLLVTEIAVVESRLDPWRRATTAVIPLDGRSLGISLGLFLSGAALVLIGRPFATRCQVSSIVIGLVLLLLGPLAAVAVRAGVPPGLTAGETILGAFGMGVVGLALVASVCRKGFPSVMVGSAVPLAVGVVGLGLTLALWAGLNREQESRINRQAQFEIAHAHRTAVERLQIHLAKLTESAGKWSRTDPVKMQDEVSLYVGSSPGCAGVARVERDLKLSWVEHRQTVPPSTLAETGAAEAIAVGLRDGQVVVARPPRSFWSGSRMLLVFTPDSKGNANTGGLLGVYRLRDVLGAIFNENVAAGYAVTISDGSEVLFTRHTTDRVGRRWKQHLPITFEGTTWQLELQPTEEVLDRESLSLPRLALLVGLLTTALLALAVYLAQTAHRRARALEAEVRERESAQMALRQSEEKYRSLIENLGQGIFLQDQESRYVTANPEFCRGVGLQEAAIVGRTDADLFEPNRAATYAEEVRTVLAEGTSIESEEERQIGGRRMVVRRVLTPVHDATGRTTGVLGICWDVTEQRLLEAQVQQASKMDAIGQLAGGIAHDFNNLLTAILGNLELLLTALPVDDPCRALAADAQNAATRAGSLTKRLLGFARRHQLDWVPTNLNGVVQEVVGLLGRTIDPRIQIETRCGADVWPVRGDPAQLNQVLMNLCLNARDAITGAGRITVETACVATAELPRGARLSGSDSGYMRLTVIDTGCGMPEEVRSRMYEPFFTTKEVGKGTGLGLAMVFATVRQHKGWIDCRSEVGRGTRFDVYLPRAEVVQPSVVCPDHSTPLRIARETILVVDDEQMIRRLAVVALQGRGYRVLEAVDGQQAVDIYAQEGERIDLVILDLTMPVLSGHEAFRHLIRLNPRVKVLFASGYAAEQLTELEKELMAGFLSKPYRPHELVAAVEDALRRESRQEQAPPEGRTRDATPALSSVG